MLIVLITVSSCSKDDLGDIRTRISSLEDWQQSVNKNINSLHELVKVLQDHDFVSGVETLPDGGGHRIIFVKNVPITIQNGEAGVSPVIGVKQHTDGKYYWTVNGEWLLSGSVKVPVAGEKGANGSVPHIGTNSNWWIGTMDTGIKAQGDAVFAKNGLDNTHADYLEVTLADGITKIRLPKYKLLKIGSDEGNEVLAISAVTTVALKLPDGLKPNECVTMVAQIVNQQGIKADIQTRASKSLWKVKVNLPTFTNGVCNNDAFIEVTPPIGIVEEDKAILEVSMISDNGNKTEVARALHFVQLYAVGDYYPDPSVTFNPDKSVASGIAPIGIVFRLENPVNGKSKNGWIVNLNESSKLLRWGAKGATKATNDWSGLANMRAIKDLDNNFDTYPAFKYVHSLNNQATDYADGSKRIWYLPALNELSILYAAYNQSPDFYKLGERNTRAQEEFNQKIKDAGGIPIASDLYLCSSQYLAINDETAYVIHFGDGGLEADNTQIVSDRVRAIAAF